MNATQALAKAKKLLGTQKVEIEVRKSVPIGEQLLIEIELRHRLSEQLKPLTEALEARRLAVLLADTEYQRLRSEVNAMTKHRDNLHGPWYRRVSIKINKGYALEVVGQGDNFEDAIASIKK